MSLSWLCPVCSACRTLWDSRISCLNLCLPKATAPLVTIIISLPWFCSMATWKTIHPIRTHTPQLGQYIYIFSRLTEDSALKGQFTPIKKVRNFFFSYLHIVVTSHDVIFCFNCRCFTDICPWDSAACGGIFFIGATVYWKKQSLIKLFTACLVDYP